MNIYRECISLSCKPNFCWAQVEVRTIAGGILLQKCVNIFFFICCNSTINILFCRNMALPHILKALQCSTVVCHYKRKQLHFISWQCQCWVHATLITFIQKRGSILFYAIYFRLSVYQSWIQEDVYGIVTMPATLLLKVYPLITILSDFFSPEREKTVYYAIEESSSWRVASIL